MFSDGIKEDIDSFESFFKQVKCYNPQIIAKEIANKFKNETEKDDVSVIVVKLERQCIDYFFNLLYIINR